MLRLVRPACVLSMLRQAFLDLLLCRRAVAFNVLIADAYKNSRSSTGSFCAVPATAAAAEPDPAAGIAACPLVHVPAEAAADMTP
jgi:hypothetical protein